MEFELKKKILQEAAIATLYVSTRLSDKIKDEEKDIYIVNCCLGLPNELINELEKEEITDESTCHLAVIFMAIFGAEKECPFDYGQTIVEEAIQTAKQLNSLREKTDFRFNLKIAAWEGFQNAYKGKNREGYDQIPQRAEDLSTSIFEYINSHIKMFF